MAKLSFIVERHEKLFWWLKNYLIAYYTLGKFTETLTDNKKHRNIFGEFTEKNIEISEKLL